MWYDQIRYLRKQNICAKVRICPVRVISEIIMYSFESSSACFSWQIERTRLSLDLYDSIHFGTVKLKAMNIRRPFMGLLSVSDFYEWCSFKHYRSGSKEGRRCIPKFFIMAGLI